MKKIFCDICGKEIKNQNETWKQELVANENNKRVCRLCMTKVSIISINIQRTFNNMYRSFIGK